MTKKNNRPALLVAAVGLLVSLAGTAHAQSAADILRAQQESERIQQLEQQRQQRDREDALRKRAPIQGIDPRALMPGVRVPDTGPLCREIKAIAINGASNLLHRDRDLLLEPFLNRCLVVADFEKLLSALTRHYVERGYITTRAYIPKQDLSHGRLEVLVIEGVVEKIMIHDGGRGSVSVANTLPGVEGEVLNLRDIEQGLDQINRLASNNATMEILPGAHPGGSVVAINNDPKPAWRVNLNYDNQGSASTGKHQAGATISGDNLLGFNDFASFTLREAVPGEQARRFSRSDSFSYALPYGYNTWFLGASRSNYVSILRTPSGLELLSEGDSNNAFAKLERVVYRDQASRATLAGSVTAKKARNYLANQLLQVSSRNLTVLDIDGNFTMGLAGGVIGFDLGYAQGLDMLGALDDQSGMTEVMPRAQFGKLKYGMSYNLPFKIAGRDAAWSSQLTGQHAYDVLYGSEQMYIGGIYSVRGYVNNTLNGDNGYYWRNDLSLRLPASAFNQQGVFKPYLSFDVGRVTQRVSGLAPDGTLSGATLGASWTVGPATVELSSSHPLTLPGWMAREGGVTYFRLSLTL